MSNNNRPLDSSIVTISFFRYAGIAKIWALQQMQLAHYPLRRVAGLQFYKLMGSGYGNGFSMRPDFSTFSLLCVWENQQAATAGIHSSRIMQAFQDHSHENWTVYMYALVSHGTWAGVSPFQTFPLPQNEPDSVVAVLTRASLHYKHLIDFWKHVPAVSKAIQGNPSLIFTKGIGEFPIIHQATFSVWASQQEMIAFAYQNTYHTEVIRKTRELGWYKEELFARFKPFFTEGTWFGKNPLASYIIPALTEKAG